MHTSGVTLDQYDDTQAEVVRLHFKTAAAVPELLKQASPDPTSLPDEAFALILQERGHKLRKYAMSDRSSAAKSAFYFMKCGQKLPQQARQVAAIKLASALYGYGIQPPEEMLKIAAIPKQMMDSSFDVKGQYKQTQQAKESSGSTARALSKVMMRRQHAKKEAFMKTSAALPNTVETTGLHAEPVQLPQSMPKEASMYALVKEGSARYPIDTMDRLNDAVQYFMAYEDRFSPLDRREYCTKVAARCDSLGLNPPRKMRHYASLEKSAQAIAVGLFQRDESLHYDHEMKGTLAELSKEAMHMAPDLLVQVLEEFDKQAGLDEYWDRGIANPVLTVYREKTAEEGEGPQGERWLYAEGNDRMSERQLREFVRNPNTFKALRDNLGHDLAGGLIKDPVNVFNSLPDPHKMQIARIATDNSDGRDKTHPVELA